MVAHRRRPVSPFLCSVARTPPALVGIGHCSPLDHPCAPTAIVSGARTHRTPAIVEVASSATTEAEARCGGTASACDMTSLALRCGPSGQSARYPWRDWNEATPTTSRPHGRPSQVATPAGFRLPSTPPVTPLLPQLASRCERSTPYHRDVIRLPEGIDVEGPIQAEVFVVWLHDDRVELTGPCGSAPWILEIGQAEHPVDMVTRIVRGAIGEPIVVHSTSWRRDRSAVILSFVVVIDQALVGSMQSEPVARTDLARSEASAAPREIAHTQVVEHGLRHLAWLVHDDPVVAAELSSAWAAALADYNPEPVRALG